MTIWNWGLMFASVRRYEEVKGWGVWGNIKYLLIRGGGWLGCLEGLWRRDSLSGAWSFSKRQERKKR